ncbi:protein DDI1 homolog 2 [Folsomia candida]|uniref:protein DDI1 homolog 2 n=1 Tax=Folsomia candida TaxID=158441 RepID=UPI000B8F9D1D|nr:protein DDI1 homolog 2 [Folsomia candida]XP_035706226.1 protein DDI1 homolog 2 [Folsomia candida]
MKVTVTSLDDNIFTLEVNEDLELENFQAFCEVESGIPSLEILIVFNGVPLTDGAKTLKEYGIKDGDMVVLQHHRQQNSASTLGSGSTPGFGFSLPQQNSQSQLPRFDFSGIQVPGRGGAGASGFSGGGAAPRDESSPAYIRDTLLNDPEQLAIVKQNNPALADALLSGDFEKFSNMIKELQRQRKQREEQRLRLLSANPFDLEAQKLIAEEIKQKNIEANMEAAMEYNPESFATVVMLYIDCKVNGHPIKAFVDSGAQTTIMSTACAERCHIMRLVDTRFSGIATGVGTQRILGRIHMCQIQIEGSFLTSSFSILADQKMDMLLGLDMLKRHQCTIDLKRNMLVLGTCGTETPFLSENELPESARLSFTKSDGTVENERAMDELGGEEIGLAKAIEESVREQKKNNPSSSNPSSISTQAVDEAKIQKIMKMGFPRDQVITELQRSNGDETAAAAALFAKSFKF